MINRKEHEKMKVENLKLRNIPDGPAILSSGTMHAASGVCGWYTECGKLVKMRD